MSTPAPPQQANSGSPGGRTIGAEVRALVTDVVNLANHLAEPAAAELLAGRAASADTTATIVVAGEAKQGKSTLVNCLLTSDGLSPVDADIATAAALRFRHGPELGVVVNLVDGRQISIDPAELPSWISMADAELERLRQVSSVEVTVPSALLEPGLVLVDTPGVGGLVSGHATMTLRSLESATAMLFVTDGDTKLTGPELEFLSRAGERIGAVVFVITKIDATPHWRQVLDENREVLAQYAPRYATAPMLGVSARLATRARAIAETDPALSANIWAESGLGQLQSWISRRIRPVATTLAAANAVALARSTVERLSATAHRNIAVASGDSAVAKAFEAEKSRVAALRHEQLTWGTTLERRLFEARTALREQVKSSAEQLRASGAELVKAAGKGDTKGVVAELDANLDAQAQDLSAASSQTIAWVCGQLLAGLNLASPLELSTTGPGVVCVRKFEPTSTRSMNMLAAGTATVMGHSVSGALLGSLPVVMAPFLVIALPLLGAVGAGYAIHHIRGAAARRTELGAWVRNEVDRAANERYADIERVLTRAKLDITEVVRAGLIEREREVSAALDAARTARDRSTQERIAAERNSRKAVTAANNLSATADQLLDTLLKAAALTETPAPGRPHPVRTP